MLVIACALALLATLFNRLHPFFDSLSQFRMHFAVLLSGLFAIALLVGARRAAIVGVGSLLVAMVATYPFIPGLASGAAFAQDGGPVLRVVQFNTRYDNSQTERAAQVIRDADADVILLQEVTDGPRSLVNLLRDAYPVQRRCGNARIGGATVISRLPVSPDNTIKCVRSSALSAIQLDVGGKAVTFAAYHGRWPWPYEQSWVIDRMSKSLEALPHPLVFAGDFNAAPWSEGVQRVARLTGTQPESGYRPTWLSQRVSDTLRPWFGLPIDHVMVSDELRIISVRRLPFAGSDHLPMVADIAL